MGRFDMYLLGGEQPGWRTLLADNGISNIGLSFSGLMRRMPKKGVDVASWGFDKVFLDSGGHAANKPPTPDSPARSVGEWEEYASTYRAFVEAHVDDFEMITEFDCEVLGRAWIKKQRLDFYDHLDREQFLPIWHPDHGIDALKDLADVYPRIGIHERAFDGPTNISSRINAVARQGVWLHGVGITKPDVLRQVEFSSAASTSWLSPMRFGETIVWDGTRLVRYPKKSKAQARRRHRTLFEQQGFNPDLIDDPRNSNEITRVSIYAWKCVEADTQRFRRSDNDEERGTPLTGTGDAVAATEDSETGNGVPAVERHAKVAIERETGTLPGLGMHSLATYDKEKGETVDVEVVGVTSAAQRVCDDCFVRDRCPAMQPGHACAYDIPIEVKTPEQRKALVDGALTMQAQRVAFMRYAEELSGGYADPNMSQEVDRLMKMMSTIADLEDNRDVFRMQIESRSRGGVMSRLFGSAATSMLGAQAPNLDRMATDDVLDRVIDGDTALPIR